MGSTVYNTPYFFHPEHWCYSELDPSITENVDYIAGRWVEEGPLSAHPDLQHRQAQTGTQGHGPLASYVKLRLAHASRMPGTFSPPSRVNDSDMHHGTCVTHVPWCKPGSLTSGFLWSRWRGKRSRYSQRMRNPQFYVSGKRPMPKTCSYTKDSNWLIRLLCAMNVGFSVWGVRWSNPLRAVSRHFGLSCLQYTFGGILVLHLVQNMIRNTIHTIKTW